MKEHVHRLTDREREVLRYVAAGWSDRQIARILRVQHRTIRSHTMAVYDKTRTDNRTQAMRWAIRNDVITLTEAWYLMLANPWDRREKWTSSKSSIR